MKSLPSLASFPIVLLAAGLCFSPLWGAPPEPAPKAKSDAPTASDQSKPSAMVMPAEPAKSDAALSTLVAQLQAKVEKLEATISKSSPQPAPGGAPAMAGMPTPAAAASQPMPGMPAAAPAPMKMMDMMGQMMGMMDKMMGMGGAMPQSASAPMPMEMDMMGMMGMAPMPAGASGMEPSSALPGFPGASHLYHIGATGFFLDHPQHINLTTAQQAGLNKAKEQALLARSTAERTIQQAEQELWTLTAADQPDATKIKAKIADIAKLSSESRFSFIAAVGEASKLLTDEQRKTLTGFMPPAPAPMAPAAASPMPSAPMKDM